mgnify:CR=1 FL=1
MNIVFPNYETDYNNQVIILIGQIIIHTETGTYRFGIDRGTNNTFLIVLIDSFKLFWFLVNICDRKLSIIHVQYLYKVRMCALYITLPLTYLH